MKHRFLFPVDSRNAVLPEYYNQLHSWIEHLPKWFADSRVPCPKATLLCGMPGVGKGTAVAIIAKTLNQPLFLLDGSIPLTDLNRLADEGQPFVIWVDRPDEQHFGLIRWLLNHDAATVFVVFTSDAPHKLPYGFTRADVISSVWHMDLPNLRQRSALWGEMLSARISGHHTHDSVKLGQLSGMFTPAEISAAYDLACRECGGAPNPGALIDSVLANEATGASNGRTRRMPASMGSSALLFGGIPIAECATDQLKYKADPVAA
jgi:hypothetical protein